MADRGRAIGGPAAWAELLGREDGDDAIERLAPELAALERRTVAEAQVTSVTDHGPAPADDAVVSVVVALHHRLDLLEHQLAARARDPEARAAQQVVVIDGPGLADRAVHAAPALADLYRLPLRLVILGAPGGRAAALDTGAGEADGELLVLMGGDVLPAGSGWISALAAAGAPAAPTLLDEHGAPLPAPPIDEPCLLVAADAFRDVGGLGDRFPGGDGAAADLVRRLERAGHPLQRQPDAVMHWLRADAPTIVPEARRYGAWLREREEAAWRAA